MNHTDIHIHGALVTLRLATLSDRRDIYAWLAHSDLTEQMMGPPNFPEINVPSWEEFAADYHDEHFDPTRPEQGRSFIIYEGDQRVGHINHGELLEDGSVELDIWMAGSEYTGQGFGTDAIRTLCDHLHETGFCRTFFIAPSLRNTAAIRSYMRAGFTPSETPPEWLVPDYADTVVLWRKMNTS